MSVRHFGRKYDSQNVAEIDVACSSDTPNPQSSKATELEQMLGYLDVPVSIRKTTNKTKNNPPSPQKRSYAASCLQEKGKKWGHGGIRKKSRLVGRNCVA